MPRIFRLFYLQFLKEIPLSVPIFFLLLLILIFYIFPFVHNKQINTIVFLSLFFYSIFVLFLLLYLDNFVIFFVSRKKDESTEINLFSQLWQLGKKVKLFTTLAVDCNHGEKFNYFAFEIIFYVNGKYACTQGKCKIEISPIPYL